MRAPLLVWPSLLAAASAAAVPLIGRDACTEPTVRKEWRELSPFEQGSYITADKCLRNLSKIHYQDLPGVVNRNDELAWTHNFLSNKIHFVATFLPWHRWFVNLHEELLRSECGYGGAQPYWDWTIDADLDAVPSSAVFDPVTGFGGNGAWTGSARIGYQRCVVDGPFANSTLTLGMGWPDDNEADRHRPHCFSRQFNCGQPAGPGGDMPVGDMQAGAYNSVSMGRVYGMENFSSFAPLLEDLPHAQIHSVILGDMGPATSPNEPLFFLHHANVDRAWVKWQGRDPGRLSDYAGFIDQAKTTVANITNIMPVLSLADVGPVVQDYMDSLSGPLCYTYST